LGPQSPSAAKRKRNGPEATLGRENKNETGLKPPSGRESLKAASIRNEREIKSSICHEELTPFQAPTQNAMN